MKSASLSRRVIIRKCDEYNVDSMAGIIREAMEELDQHLHGLRHLGMKSPAWDPRNMALLIYHSIIKFFMQITIPLRKSAKIHRTLGK
jgi:hypothetical protein